MPMPPQQQAMGGPPRIMIDANGNQVMLPPQHHQQQHGMQSPFQVSPGHGPDGHQHPPLMQQPMQSQQIMQQMAPPPRNMGGPAGPQMMFQSAPPGSVRVVGANGQIISNESPPVVKIMVGGPSNASPGSMGPQGYGQSPQHGGEGVFSGAPLMGFVHQSNANAPQNLHLHASPTGESFDHSPFRVPQSPGGGSVHSEPSDHSFDNDPRNDNALNLSAGARDFVPTRLIGSLPSSPRGSDKAQGPNGSFSQSTMSTPSHSNFPSQLHSPSMNDLQLNALGGSGGSNGQHHMGQGDGLGAMDDIIGGSLAGLNFSSLLFDD